MRHNAILGTSRFIAFILATWFVLNSQPAIAQVPLGPHPAVERFFCEEILEVSLDIGAVTDLRGMTLDLGFDPAVISPLAVLAGDLVNSASCGSFLQWLNPYPGENHLAIDLGLLGCSISGTGELLKIQFAGVANGLSPLQMNSVELRDSNNQLISSLSVNSEVEYRCPRPGTLSFVPDDGSFGCEETLTVDVDIDEGTLDVHGFSLELSFDETVVHPISVSAGSLVSGAACPYYFNWLNPGPGESTVAVDVANLGCAIDGPGTILHLVFEGVLQGISPLDCVSLIFRDSQNHPIAVECVPGSLEYRCPVPTASMGWGAWKARYGH
jgi:hypothetical protein